MHLPRMEIPGHGAEVELVSRADDERHDPVTADGVGDPDDPHVLHGVHSSERPFHGPDGDAATSDVEEIRSPSCESQAPLLRLRRAVCRLRGVARAGTLMRRAGPLRTPQRT